MTEHRFELTAHGRVTPAVLRLSDGAPPAGGGPAVVLLHGTASDKDEVGGGYRRLAGHLAAAGISSLRFDFVGSGESGGSEADFDFANAQEDVSAALDHLRRSDEIAGTRIGVLGWSQGGIHALLAAGAIPAFGAVVTWAAPATAPSTLVTPEIVEQAERQGFAEIALPWRDRPLLLGRAWVGDARTMDLPTAVARITAPLLTVHGTADLVVPPRDAATIAGWSAHPESRALLLSGADHTLNLLGGDESVFEQAAAASTDWFSRHL